MKGKNKGIVFPATRIKRIMRTNEEVGKIAVLTPVLVSKALQLMLQDFVASCCDIARMKGSSVVTLDLMELCMKNFNRFSFLLRASANKRKLDCELLERTREPSCLELKNKWLDFTKESRHSRKRHSVGDATIRNRKKERVISCNNSYVEDSKRTQTRSFDIFPLHVSLQVESEQDNYDCDEEDSVSCVENDQSEQRDIAIMNEKLYNGKRPQEEHVSNEGGLSKSESTPESSLYFAVDKSISCLPTRCSEEKILNMQVTESTSRVFLSIEDLIHSE